MLPSMAAAALTRTSSEQAALVPGAPAAGAPSQQPVWWLHIPKCGTSFKESAELYVEDPEHSKACCGYTHKRVPADASDETLSHVVAMFREPKQRAASAYYYMKKKSSPDGVNRCCERDWGWLKTVYRPIRAQIRDGAAFGDTLANFKGCQANMVMGHGCMERPDTWIDGNWSTTANLAIRRMQKFRFVGIESEWLLSICLFNFKLTGRRYVTRNQIVDSHATHKIRGKAGLDLGTQTFTEYDVAGYPEDPLDGPLYSAVEARFWEEVKAHEISKRHCIEESTNAAVSLRRTASAVAEEVERPRPLGEDSWVDEEAVQKWSIPLVQHQRREAELSLAALVPPQLYSDQAILTSSLRKQLEGFCERRKTDYRCQKGATSMGMKALSTVTPADLDNADLPLSDEEFAAMLDIAMDGLYERDPAAGAERAEKADWPRLQLDEDTGGAYWTTAKGQTPALNFGAWQKAGNWPRASCAVVGSGAALSGRGLGPEIDAHDVVVVVNNMPAKTDHADMGSRMDVFFQSAAGVLSQDGPTGARMVVSTGGHDPAVSPICHTSGEDEPRCIDRFKAMIVRNMLLDPPGWQNAHYMRDFANASEVGLAWSGKMVTTLVHHLRRPGTPDEGKPSTGFHALVTMALLCSSVELCECLPFKLGGAPICTLPDRPDRARSLPPSHGHLPIALLRADGFTGTDTVDGRTEGVVHNIEGEHRILQRLVSKSIPQSEFPDETTFRAWATTNVSVVL